MCFSKVDPKSVVPGQVYFARVVCTNVDVYGPEFALSEEWHYPPTLEGDAVGGTIWEASITKEEK